MLQVTVLQIAVGYGAVVGVQPQVVPDAQVVVVVLMQLDQTALPVEALLGRQVGAVLHHDDDHVVDRGGHVLRLAAAGVVSDLLDGGVLEEGFVPEGLLILAEEGVAEGLVEGCEAWQQGAVAGLGAVVGVLLIHGGGFGHIPCRAQALGAGGRRQGLRGLVVGGGVAAVAYEAVYLLPVGLCCGGHGCQQGECKDDAFHFSEV